MRLEVGWGSLGSLYVLCCFQLSDTKVQLGLARLLRVLLFGATPPTTSFAPYLRQLLLHISHLM